MDRWMIGYPGRGRFRQPGANCRGPCHYNRDRCVMDMQRLGNRTAGLRIGLRHIEIVPVRMNGTGVVVRVDLAPPDPGQKQAEQRNAEQ